MKSQRRRFVLVVLVAVSVCAVGAPELSAQTAAPFVGTWQLNPSKSKFVPIAYQSSTVTVEPVGDRRKTTVETVLANGLRVRYEFTAEYDGEEYPLTGLSAQFVSMKRIDARTIERVHKLDGKVDATFVSRVSPDGKTLTVQHKGISPQGDQVDNALVFERK